MPDRTLSPSLLIDARELAAMLAISVPTIWRMRESGRLPEPLRLTSQTLRWRRSDVESWLAAGCPCPDVRCGESLPTSHSTNSNQENFRATN